MIVVTSYDSPDLDGVACSIAYAELLLKENKNAQAVYFGELGLEVDFVKKYTNHFPLTKHGGEYEEDTEFVLVDTSDPDALEPAIDPKKVIEIYDHRQLVFVEKFITAKKTIELVGSCATLITEEFIKRQLEPSENSAVYLYSAIISNTINFKNLVTTQRDIDAVKFLKKFIDLPHDYIKQMFTAKSNFDLNNIYKVLDQDFAIKEIHGKKIGIAQFEITELEETLKKLGGKLGETLKRLKTENNLDYIFFTGIDIFEGYNIFYIVDEESKEVFAKALEITDFKNGYKTKEIIMRKQIWPKLDSVMK